MGAISEPSLTIAITKTPAGNTVAVSRAVLEALPQIEDSLGNNTKFTVVFGVLSTGGVAVESGSKVGSIGRSIMQMRMIRT